MPACEICQDHGRISCGACWGGQTHPVCPDCLGKGEVDGRPCGRCCASGKITPPSCPVCGNSLPCPVCGGQE